MRYQKQIIKQFLSTIAFVLLFQATASLAEDNTTEKKSLAVALILGLDPIPGDALFYAGRPIQGTINLALGALGLGELIYAYYSTDCYGREDDCTIGNAVLGGLCLFSALVWDLGGGVGGVLSHNKAVKSQKVFVPRFVPLASVSGQHAVVGAQFRF